LRDRFCGDLQFSMQATFGTGGKKTVVLQWPDCNADSLREGKAMRVALLLLIVVLWLATAQARC
jgi:hypothetical protein